MLDESVVAEHGVRRTTASRRNAVESVGLTISGDNPAAATTSRAKPNQLVSPPEVACHAPDGRVRLHEPHHQVGDVAGPRRLPDLVVHDVEAASLAGDTRDRAREAGAVRAVQPAGADDQVTSGAASRTADSPAALVRPYADCGRSGASSAYGDRASPSKT